MINIDELREMPEARRLFRLYALALVLWIALAVIVTRISAMKDETALNLASADQVINIAALYKSYPEPEQAAASQSGTDSVAAVSEIVETLELRSRMSQLQANASGVQLQLDRLYGKEMSEFLDSLEEKDLRVRTAEIKTLSGPGGLVLNASFLLE
jgi:type II secretory pathway component PulM